MLAIAALSARALAEAARADGHPVVALDVFGDLDTRRAASAWRFVGDGTLLRIQHAALLAGLQHAASQGAVGWIAGSGFEADLGLLQAGAAVLPLLGNPAPVWRAVRDPAQFFGCLQAAGLPHPAWQATVPVDATGWLLKDPCSSGGSAVQHLAHWRRSGQPLPATAYVQRLLPGLPVSLTFIANGQRARVLGANLQQVQALGADGACRPFSFAGVIGPVCLPAAAQATLHHALRVLVARFQLRGLGSLDVLLHGDQVQLLELNPRPPASLQLYPAAAGQGVVAAHLKACRLLHQPGHQTGHQPVHRPVHQPGGLPAQWPTVPAAAAKPPQVHGLRVVHAPGRLHVTPALSAQLAAWPGAQDLPQPGTQLAGGDPLCSLQASASSAAAVQAALHAAQASLLLAVAASAVKTAADITTNTATITTSVTESLPT